jgi:hypothetical protein
MKRFCVGPPGGMRLDTMVLLPADCGARGQFGAIIATIAEGSAHLDDTITDLILKPAHAVEPVSRLSEADFILATSPASLFTIRRLGPGSSPIQSAETF